MCRTESSSHPAGTRSWEPRVAARAGAGPAPGYGWAGSRPAPTSPASPPGLLTLCAAPSATSRRVRNCSAGEREEAERWNRARSTQSSREQGPVTSAETMGCPCIYRRDSRGHNMHSREAGRASLPPSSQHIPQPRDPLATGVSPPQQRNHGLLPWICLCRTLGIIESADDLGLESEPHPSVQLSNALLQGEPKFIIHLLLTHVPVLLLKCFGYVK